MTDLRTGHVPTVAVTDGTPSPDPASAGLAGAIEVRELHSLVDLQRVSEIFRVVWDREDGADLVPAEMLRAMTHAGNHAAGAFVDGEMVGAAVGFLGLHHGDVHLHSHVMGFLPEHRGRGLGVALKLQQREWALARGIDTITWTFDPLVRRNAWFNLTKLGAVATDYHVDFYGTMQDRINGGEPSDRLVVTWELTADRAVAASLGSPDAPGPDLLAAATPLVVVDDDEGPRVARAPGELNTVQVPADIVALRTRDPRLARAWRLAVRDTLGMLLGRGHVAVSAGRDGGYLVVPGPDLTTTVAPTGVAVPASTGEDA